MPCLSSCTAFRCLHCKHYKASRLRQCLAQFEGTIQVIGSQRGSPINKTPYCRSVYYLVPAMLARRFGALYHRHRPLPALFSHTRSKIVSANIDTLVRHQLDPALVAPPSSRAGIEQTRLLTFEGQRREQDPDPKLNMPVRNLLCSL